MHSRGLYPIYIRHSNDSTTNNVKFNNLSRNWVNDLNRYFSKAHSKHKQPASAWENIEYYSESHLKTLVRYYHTTPT